MADSILVGKPEARTSRGSRAGLLKRIYRAIVGANPPDPFLSWRGTSVPGRPALNVLHVGDCGARQMDVAHDLLAPPGYPLWLARALLRFGLGLAFLHFFCVNFEELPEIDAVQSLSRFEAVPDILLIQIGSAYTRRVILPDTRRVHQLRDELARRAGRLTPAFYRLLRPFVRVFGRHSTPYRGVTGLECFIRSAREAWPSVHVVLVLPFRRSPGYPSGEAIARRVEADLYSLTHLPAVSVFDANSVLGRDPVLRCLTGYNLNGRGSELVGEELARWLIPRVPISEAEPMTTPA
jgi:hypothetical protein